MQIQTLAQYLPPFLTGLNAWVLLGVRLVWGTVLVVYSFPMIKNPLHWMDINEKPSGFPGFLQALGAIAVFGGGIGLMFGLLTPLAALGLAFAMIIALSLHLAHGIPFVKSAPDAPGESYDTSLLYFMLALLFVCLGPGALSLDFLIFGRL
ncbi:DoxX family protein [Aetokthonos hydrillicola Thurmond2011]|jgi:putative oxidoreductase|uniref:DoxX family protein n=1 Tax=Aetokthonos hydrillicola Thurmond2011 TaxID=2712845 RepID=A0AAP5I6I4_9CYAN|nr:DoxX family protein [Aetokthonos hydrillicola]MBO3461803.1 DoxX family protein [Aetokthonos hydrillicola CCALA 1050]MBW4589947.1 DoxX family protein [Aetokthonos hydrillicola CCALA 1050]MDR9895726.1 DoxX family protein [Aetokthonos hydrillicola Thurmond2011]